MPWLDGEIKNCKIHEGILEMFFVICLILLSLLIIFVIKKLRLKALQKNNKINQPDIVIVNNDAQTNIETNQNNSQNILKK